MKTWQTTLLIVAIAGALVYVTFEQLGETWTAHQIAGAAMGIPAFCLWALARLQLGKSFAIRAKAKQLVTRGPYSKIRNPVYVFGGIFIAGMFVFFGKPYLLLLFVILVPLQWKRVRNEERVLEEKFGDEYRAYKQRTWF
jgi:protein-S-isoprenylcysteine O-methyltransferase Ste14